MTEFNRKAFEQEEQRLAELKGKERHDILDELIAECYKYAEDYILASWVEFEPKEKENPLWWKRYRIHVLRYNRHTTYHISLAVGYKSPTEQKYVLHATELKRRHISKTHFTYKKEG